ncbi:MAG: polyribonucleotide nucleotidyltransferase, partial [Planctomycetota bacterium]|jgi:polyribonucleotide nucleotidyltransferase|nr:polyribonucleotide nucleotidyltransferase [Planctomycetota bacterium]
VPLAAPVAGIAMGLVKEGDRYAVLTDILGDEDHYGDMDFKVCGTADGITALQMDIKIAGKPKVAFEEAAESAWVSKLVDKYTDRIRTALQTSGKFERGDAVKAVRGEIMAEIAGDDEELAGEIKSAFGSAKDVVFRELILSGTRVDGRDTKTVRPIVVDLDLLPRAHGSALFTRGETQGLLVCTLGTADDEQMIESLKPKRFDRFLLHYNFPGFSVGECGGRPGPGRREIGHGALAKRALSAVLPSDEEWPYTIRIVSDITESNGSSSMATVCGGSLSMMAAGVPLAAPVAGIAMGLVKEGDRYAVLTDILGDEDHYGDMDYKVCGTSQGITALQMDIKIAGISADLMGEALEQARQGRMHILEKMNESISTHREELSPYAPQIVQVQIDPEFIGKIIGKGGETIRKIQEDSGASVNIDDDGVITLASPDMNSIEKAKQWISDLTELPEEGRVYSGTVTSVKEFGAFVEFIPGTEGLVHISEWDWSRTENMDDVAKAGTPIEVKLIEVDARTGRFRLSRRALLDKPEGYDEAAAAAAERRGSDRGGDRGDRGGRGGDRGGDRRGPRRDGDRRPRSD